VSWRASGSCRACGPSEGLGKARKRSWRRSIHRRLAVRPVGHIRFDPVVGRRQRGRPRPPPPAGHSTTGARAQLGRRWREARRRIGFEDRQTVGTRVAANEALQDTRLRVTALHRARHLMVCKGISASQGPEGLHETRPIATLQQRARVREFDGLRGWPRFCQGGSRRDRTPVRSNARTSRAGANIQR